MFKTTEDYDKAIYNALVYIRDNNSFPKANDKNEECDLGDVINLCNRRGYLDGISVTQNIVGNYRCDGRPRLTYQGLAFIENFNK